MRSKLWHCICTAVLLPTPVFSQTCHTKADLRIPEGTEASSCFSVADTDNDGKVCGAQISDLESCIASAITVIPSNAQPGQAAVTLYSGADCSGDDLDVANNAEEDLCSGCFDVCGRQFTGAATSDSKLHVRSLRVKLGMVRITYTGCYGRESLSDPSMDAAANYSGPMDNCFNFKNNLQPKHFELFEDDSALKGAKQYMAFHDANKDGLVTKAEAEDMDVAFDAIDTSGDGMISTAELTAFIATFKTKANDESVGYGRSAMEDMARSTLMADESRTTPPATAEIEAEATRLYGKEYARAKLVTSHTASNTPDPTIVAGQTDGSVHICADGRLSKLSLCYKPCNWEHPHDVLDRCWASCPSGTTDIGLFCAESVISWQNKPNYYRGVGTPIKRCKLGESFGPGRFTGDAKTQFTFGVVSDPQLPWCSVGSKGDRECAIRENQEMVKALNNVGYDLDWGAKGDDVVRPLSGVFLNGDLTAFAHEWQFDMFRKLYEENSDAVSDNNLKLPIWLNLGNHDIANNVEDCHFMFQELYWLGYGSNGCAQRMLAYVRSAVTGCGDNTIVPAFGGRVDHYDVDSAAYTVSFGKVRVVMLHNYPSYDAYGKLEQFKSSMAFLKKEIKHTNTSKDYLVLMWHDNGDHFKDDLASAEFKEFFDLVAGSRVIATFHGHIHSSGGDYMRGLRGVEGGRAKFVNNQWGQRIPAIRSFASDQRKFVIFDYNEARCAFRYGSVTATNGVPAWHKKEETRYMKTLTLQDCTIGDVKECPVGVCSPDCPSCAGTESCINNRCVGWSNWVSEESGASMAKKHPLSGMQCQGRYCDKIRVRYEPAFTIEDEGTWTEWASDTENRLAKCPQGQAAVQVDCKDSYCGQIRLRCARLPNLADVSTKQTDWFSEENGGQMTCSDSEVIIAVECKERQCWFGFDCKHHCDDKRLLCTATSEFEVAGNLLAQSIVGVGVADAAPAMSRLGLLSSMLVAVLVVFSV